MSVKVMREAVLSLPEQLRWARALSEREVAPAPVGLVAGMGGSGMAGEFAVLTAHRPTIVHRSYGLPEWAEEARPLVVAVSYSGETEETVDAARVAEKLGLALAVVSSGGRLGEMAGARDLPAYQVPAGLQPRAALGYLAGATLRLLDAAGLAAGAGGSLDEAEAVLKGLFDDGEGPAVALAEDLAEGMDGKIPLVIGAAGPAALAAHRWKTQMNENAKSPAFWSVFPEANHNELEGWANVAVGRRFGLVYLQDPSQHPRISTRFRLATESLEGGGPVLVGEVWAEGSSPLARAMSLTAVGDLASVAMAERSGFDPEPVARLEDFKRRLREEESP